MTKSRRFTLFSVLILLGVCAAAVLSMQGRKAPPRSVATPAAEREQFEMARPLRLELIAGPDERGRREDLAWLSLELHRLLARAGLRVIAPTARTEPGVAHSEAIHEQSAFTLRVALPANAQEISIALIAPDFVLERERSIALADAGRLATVQSLAQELPLLLGVDADWTPLVATLRARSYDAFTRALTEVLGRDAGGYTRPSVRPSRNVERLERIARMHPQFARAHSLLALAYLSVGGEDEKSLTQLAESSAMRALSIDPADVEAHAASGLVALRRSQWIPAHEQFEAALAIDAYSAPALEGMACLLTDVGRYEQARRLAQRVLDSQPANAGASECLAYIETAQMPHSRADTNVRENIQGTTAAHVRALGAVLAGDVATAQRVLRDALSARQLQDYAEPVLRAAADRRHAPAALRAVTRAANEQRIDASTQILCGATLREAEFVFNRISRLRRERSHAPLRLFWLAQTNFLRTHARFPELVGEAGLPAYWREYGRPDVCDAEPDLYGCRLGVDRK